MAVVTITGTGLNLATAANNFTISIINTSSVTTQYATNISRATLISGYNVTVNPGDVTVRATSTGTCSSSADVDVSTLALQSYQPSPVSTTAMEGYPESFANNQGNVEYIIGEITIYPFMNVSGFTLTHVSTTGADGLSAASGPFVPPTLEVQADINDNTIAYLIGYTRNSYSQDNITNTSTYRVTYTPTGLYRDFNFYWVAGV